MKNILKATLKGLRVLLGIIVIGTGINFGLQWIFTSSFGDPTGIYILGGVVLLGATVFFSWYMYNPKNEED